MRKEDSDFSVQSISVGDCLIDSALICFRSPFGLIPFVVLASWDVEESSAHCDSLFPPY